MKRVTYEVIPFYNARFKAQIRVDGHDVSKAYFDSFKEAEKWAKGEVRQLESIVRER